jgi:tetratricopeptide (TPR) repeat protein
MSVKDWSFLAVATFILVGAAACSKTDEPRTPSSSAPRDTKIPITTSSEEARKEFVTARDMTERLLATESIAHYDKAIALDPAFALAELNRAGVSATGKEFFEHLAKAVSLSGRASNGERLLILATEAGANNDTAKQKELLGQLEAAYPNDERAHFNVGGFYFGQQDFPKAIEHYQKATELAPTYSPAFNLLGYAYRQNGDYANAEQAFKTYIALIPNDPNPYDSYAELLLKMGRFDQSIEQYRKALAVDGNFMASHAGIAAALTYQGKPTEAAAELTKVAEKARNDGERRIATFGLTVIAVDSGRLDDAVAEVDKQYAIAEKTKDVPAMTADLQLKGNLLIEAGKAAAASTQYEQLLKMTEESNLSPQFKENARLVHHQNLARVSLAEGDVAGAKTHADAFMKGAETRGNPVQVRQAHALAGTIALQEKKYDEALQHLGQAGSQDPAVLYRSCLAREAKGEHAQAKQLCTQAADFNSLPLVNYALVRNKAKAMAAKITS